MADPDITYLDADHCSGVMEVVLSVFVVVKALILIFFSVQGIFWFLKNRFTAIAVVSTLIISCALVSTNLRRCLTRFIFSSWAGHYRDGLSVHRQVYPLSIHPKRCLAVASFHLSDSHDGLRTKERCSLVELQASSDFRVRAHPLSDSTHLGNQK